MKTKRERELRLHRCCFINVGVDKLTISEDFVKNKLKENIKNAIHQGYNVFITGMDDGIDLWAAEMVLEYKSVFHNIKLICALPYPEYCKTRNNHARNVSCKRILERADFVKVVCDKQTPDCLYNKNIWMIDHSSFVIAVSDGSEEGANTALNYASEQGISVKNLLKIS